MRNRTMFIGACAAALAFATAARATTVSDPAGDFISTYTGPLQADLDVLSFSVSYNSALSAFLLQSTMNGTIDPSLGGFYAIGVNTGTGPSNFASIGRPGVQFNQVISVQKNGTGTVSGAAGGALAAGSIVVAGSTFSAIVPLSLLPTTGFDPTRYGFNIWPRSGTTGGTAVISDFAPENSTIAAAAVPEPATWALMITGFGMMGAALRRAGTDERASASRIR